MAYKVLILGEDGPNLMGKDANSLEKLESFLTLRGYDVITASDTDEMLDKVISSELIDLVLLPIGVFHGMGTVMLQYIKKDRLTTQVILLTDHMSANAQAAYLDFGIDDFFQTPIRDFDELAEVVHVTCQRIDRWNTITRASSVAKTEDKNPIIALVEQGKSLNDEEGYKLTRDAKIEVLMAAAKDPRTLEQLKKVREGCDDVHFIARLDKAISCANQ